MFLHIHISEFVLWLTLCWLKEGFVKKKNNLVEVKVAEKENGRYRPETLTIKYVRVWNLMHIGVNMESFVVYHLPPMWESMGGQGAESPVCCRAEWSRTHCLFFLSSADGQCRTENPVRLPWRAEFSLSRLIWVNFSYREYLNAVDSGLQKK